MFDWAHVWVEQAVIWQIHCKIVSECDDNVDDIAECSCFVLFSTCLYIAFHSFLDIADISKHM